MSQLRKDTLAQAQHIIIAANPKSGASSGLTRANELKEALIQDGWQVELTTDLEQMQRLVNQRHESGELRCVVSAGGDGTAAAILNRIPIEIPLAIFPLGSENLLAQQFHIPRDPQQLVSMIRELHIRELDLFRANGKLFLIMVSVGFDAQVVKQVHENRKSHITRWAYRFAILSSVFSYKWPTLCIENRVGERWEPMAHCHWLFGFNVPKYAAGIHVIDDAICDDGRIDIGMLTGANAIIGFWNYLRVALGTHRVSPRWRENRVEGFRVTSENPQAFFQLDGDFGGALPLEVSFTNARAKLVVPKDSARVDALKTK